MITQTLSQCGILKHEFKALISVLEKNIEVLRPKSHDLLVNNVEEENLT